MAEWFCMCQKESRQKADGDGSCLEGKCVVPTTRDFEVNRGVFEKDVKS